MTKISPKTPRALFFNNSVAVGSVQDGKVFELALMTLEHQAHMTNFIISLNQQFRRALTAGTLETSKASLNRSVDQMVDYMLFVDEAPLSDPVKGVSTFTVTFPERGPHDSHGRSLRDFDLEKRLFRYPRDSARYQARRSPLVSLQV